MSRLSLATAVTPTSAPNVTPASLMLFAARKMLTDCASFDVETGDYHFTVDDMTRIRATMNLACEALDTAAAPRALALTTERGAR